MHVVAKALRTIQDELNARYLEREDPVEAAMLAVLAKEHMFILGPPGTSKSAFVRDLAARFIGARYFETSMSKTRPEQALIGPLDMQALKESHYIRKGDGFLQTAHIAMVDEVGKMSPVVGHSLLSIANERVFHEVNGGRSSQQVPLYSMFCPSNELLIGESDDAAALWDRLLVRVAVGYITERSSFIAMITGSTEPVTTTTVPWEDLADVIDTVVPAVRLSTDTVEGLVALREEMRDAGIAVSDRRYKWACKLMQASAFLEGRDETTSDDLAALRFALWETPDQIAPIERMCLSRANPVNEKLVQTLADLAEIRKGIAAREGQSTAALAAYASEVVGKLKPIKASLEQMAETARTSGRSVTKIDGALRAWSDVRADIYVKCLGMDEATVRKTR